MAGNEIRCTELGANCICSEPLNTSTYTEVSADYYSAGDTTTKKCYQSNSVPGSVLTSDAGTFAGHHQVATSGPMFAAAPNLDPSITHFLRTNDGADGGYLGCLLQPTDPIARIAMRFYLYRSSDFVFTGGACLNSDKIFELFIGFSTCLVFQGQMPTTIYGWNPPPGEDDRWNITVPSGYDCCSTGPNLTEEGFNTANSRDKWWRYEVVVTNRTTAGPTTVIKLFARNITDDEPEITVIDTSVPTPQPIHQDWTSTCATTLKPLDSISYIANVPFRNGSCAGYYGFSHYLMAAWDTDAGQRIGAATEMEGDGDAGLTIDDSAHEWFIRQAQTNPLKISRW